MKMQPSIFEIVNKFADEEKCIAHFERIRWPKGLECPRCESKRIMKFDAEGKTQKVRHLYECVDCRYQYSVTTGTIFHDSHTPLTKWFLAIYLVCSGKKGISAKELQRQLGVTYKTAWYMAHRVRTAMSEDDEFCQKFSGIVEADETYVGGKRKGPRGRGAASKVPVIAVRERTSGKVRMQAVENASASVSKTAYGSVTIQSILAATTRWGSSARRFGSGGSGNLRSLQTNTSLRPGNWNGEFFRQHRRQTG
ncbi:MAG TPA: IS1595 family transposase [Terriglobales bacterium]|nr:IS1595 family transposase [Terriglobales bacterium]